MRVTKRQPSKSLKMVVDFLNHRPEDFEDLRLSNETLFLLLMPARQRYGEKWAKVLKDAQDRMIETLAPLTVQEPKHILTDKSRPWNVDPFRTGDHQLDYFRWLLQIIHQSTGRRMEWTVAPLDPSDNTQYANFDAWDRSWAMALTLSKFGRKPLMTMEYIDQRMMIELFNILETGEIIGRFRGCKSCAVFFIASDPRERYCKEACRLEFHKATASKRVMESRKRTKAKRKAEHSLRIERTIKEVRFKQFKRFYEVSGKTRRTDAETAEIYEPLKRLGNGRPAQGWRIRNRWKGTAREVWATIPDEQRALVAP